MSHYTVYKITNILTGQFYIGAHKTECLDDGYLGSGKHIKAAIRKHGTDAFRKDYIAIFQSSEEMFAFEAQLVTEELVADPRCYNLKEGGIGGMGLHNRDPANRAYRRSGALARNALPVTPATRQKLSKKMQARWAAGDMESLRSRMATNFKGRKHTEETKHKISAANRVAQAGSGNSQFGKCWVYHPSLKVSEKVTKDAVPARLTAGWIRGRKMRFD